MTTVTVTPGVARGKVAAPPSKSYTHRALVVGYLSGRRYRVRTPLRSDDTIATARGLESLGAEVDRASQNWTVTRGASRSSNPARRRIHCGRSGTTLRLLTAVAALEEGAVRFDVDRQLAARPIGGLLGALRSLGAEVRTGPVARRYPITIRGPLRAGQVSVPVNQSSQFASALLLVLPVLPARSVLRLAGTLVSKPYLEATMAMLRAHRVRLQTRGPIIRLEGDQRYIGRGFRVPGDASSASYLWAAAAISGGRVTVRGIDVRWPQADLAILRILERMGCAVTRTASTITVSGRSRRPVSADLTQAPDLLPLVGALAAATPGRSQIRGALHAAHKESNRRRETARIARAMGARTRLTDRFLEIDGTSAPRAVRLRGLQDHRLVMSAAVGALAAQAPSRLSDADAVRKSFPGFWKALGSLGVGVGRWP